MLAFRMLLMALIITLLGSNAQAGCGLFGKKKAKATYAYAYGACATPQSTVVPSPQVIEATPLTTSTPVAKVKMKWKFLKASRSRLLSFTK